MLQRAQSEGLIEIEKQIEGKLWGNSCAHGAYLVLLHDWWYDFVVLFRTCAIVKIDSHMSQIVIIII